MNSYSGYVLLLFAILVVWELSSYRLHLGRRKKIRTVINVNGTRGKTSVARLLCYALREAGFKVMGKTTGTVPQILSVNGEINAIPRGDHPNICEQLMVVKKAAEQRAEVLVAECMAIDPVYQKIMEEKMLRSDIGVITNVRQDHREVMGSNREQIAQVLCNTLPRGKVVFTAERENFHVIAKEAAKKKCKTAQCRSEHLITDEMMRPFPFFEHRQNVALVLDICGYLGVDEETALKGMYKTVPDPEVLSSIKVCYDNRHMEFVNAFSTNDPDSMVLIWKRMMKGWMPGQKIFFIFNARSDRPYRSVDTADVFSKFPIDIFIAMGDGARLFIRALRRGGTPKDRIMNMEGAKVRDIFKKCADNASEKNFIFCAGNVKNKGAALISYIQELNETSAPKESV